MVTTVRWKPNFKDIKPFAGSSEDSLKSTNRCLLESSATLLPCHRADSGFSFTPTKNPATTTPTATTAAAAVTPSKSSFAFELPKPTMSFGPTLTSTSVTVTSATAGDKKAAVSEKSTFEFVFKPKSPGKPKIPGWTISVGSAGDEGKGEEAGADDGTVAEEENNTFFTPVIPLPDKVEVKTDEEEENVLYSHRTKLFRFVVIEWKERSIGDVKILKHKTTGKLRVVMRCD